MDNPTAHMDGLDMDLAHAAETITELEQQRDELLVAGKALVDRWDTPNWKDAVHTSEFIAKLRDVIAKIEGE